MKLQQLLKSGDLFDELDREYESQIRKINIKKNRNLENLCQKFEIWLNGFPQVPDQNNDSIAFNAGNFNAAFNIIGYSSKYSSQDILAFSILFKKYEREKWFNFSGLFLSALFALSPDKRFNLNLAHLEDRYPHHLGYLNKKNIIIRGNVGDRLGECMEKGKIVVYGDVWNSAGILMNRGLIEIYGSADHYVGSKMKNGIIKVYGDVNNHVGHEMESGKIYVEGRIGEISNTLHGGNIYHKGKLIVKNGWKVR